MGKDKKLNYFSPNRMAKKAGIKSSVADKVFPNKIYTETTVKKDKNGKPKKTIKYQEIQLTEKQQSRAGGFSPYLSKTTVTKHKKK